MCVCVCRCLSSLVSFCGWWLGLYIFGFNSTTKEVAHSHIIIGLTRLEQLDQVDLKSLTYGSGLLNTTVAGLVGLQWAPILSTPTKKERVMHAANRTQPALLSPNECSACIHVRWEPLYACGCCLPLLVGTAGVGWPSLHVTTHSKKRQLSTFFPMLDPRRCRCFVFSGRDKAWLRSLLSSHVC